MPRERAKYVVMCAPADTSPLASLGVSIGVCDECFTRILVSVTTRQLQTRAHCTLLCLACVKKLNPELIEGYGLAGKVDEIRREMRTVGPNPFRKANN